MHWLILKATTSLLLVAWLTLACVGAVALLFAFEIREILRRLSPQ